MTRLYVISGHGAGDSGAVGNGYKEADIVRQISTRLKAIGGDSVIELDKGINWYAAGRVNLDLKRTVGSNPVIELHLDSGPETAKGGHVIIKDTLQADSYDKAIADFLRSYFPGRSEVIVKRGNLANINRAAANGINYRLVECCFVTNSDDMRKLIGDMDAFCRGILKAFGIGTANVPETKPVESKPVTASKPAQTAPKPVSKPATTSNWVAKLQEECNRQGFSKQVVDGIPGKNTLAGCPTVSQGARGNITKLLQERLNALGFNCGAADGVFGEKTKKAVRAFQKSKGLADDGVVGQNTWRKLLGL